jgi:hypothetical protein
MAPERSSYAKCGAKQVDFSIIEKSVFYKNNEELFLSRVELFCTKNICNDVRNLK